MRAGRRPIQKVIAADLPAFERLALPYSLYTDADLTHRVVYVEASRGCPFKCEFCLSSLDVPVRNVPLELFLGEMRKLLDRGLRQQTQRDFSKKRMAIRAEYPADCCSHNTSLFAPLVY